MAFTGDLEHLPIVDVIQLLNSTRKSGVLSVKGRKGTSQLVFKDGYIVSASHLNNSVRIGQVLVEQGLITPEQLEQGLQKQQFDGDNRRPLAITLIEMAILSEDNAYRGLQHLIEMTVVEILSWKSGRFTLDHLKDVVACDFKYYPEKMHHEINVNTQSILMDALRIFDEKMRDGLIEEETEEPLFAAAAVEESISADDLGLSELDLLEDSLPHTFVTGAPFDPISFQLDKLQRLLPALSPADKEKIAVFLAKHTLKPGAEKSSEPVAKLVVAGADSLFIHALETVAKSAGIFLHAAGSGEEVESAAEKALLDGVSLRVIFDGAVANGSAGSESLVSVRNRLCSRYPQLVCLQLVADEPLAFALDAYRSGVRALVPRPSFNLRPESYADELIALVNFLPSYLLTA